MKIPKEDLDRLNFVRDLVEKCEVSMSDRKARYERLRSYYLFGGDRGEAPAKFNKIGPHIQQVASFMYSAETTRFAIQVGASVPPKELKKIPALTHAINDKWLDSDSDFEFGVALDMSFIYGTSFVMWRWKNGPKCYAVHPGSVGVLREDLRSTSRQEAFVRQFWMTRSALEAELENHSQKAAILKDIEPGEKQEETRGGLNTILLASFSPTLTGSVTGVAQDDVDPYLPDVKEETVQMRELWVWNDEKQDYRVFTLAGNGTIVYDRDGEELFVKGFANIVQICPTPLYDYYWGQSEVGKLINLQRMRNTRIDEIDLLLAKQADPPKSYMGMGLAEEKLMAMGIPGAGLIGEQGSKYEEHPPKIADNLYGNVKEIDDMFDETSGLNNVTQGRGEHGVRSTGHASQLAQMGSSRIKQRALKVEDSLDHSATLLMMMIQEYDDTHFFTEDGEKFTAKQFTEDFVVKVDAHSNSPIFVEDQKELIFSMLKNKMITPERAIDLLDVPMKQLLKQEAAEMRKKQEAAQQAEQQAKQQPPAPAKPPAQPPAGGPPGMLDKLKQTIGMK